MRPTPDPTNDPASARELGSAGVSNLLLFLLLCVGAYPVVQGLTGKSIAVAPPRWEHKVVQFEREEAGSFGGALDQLAAGGWEYVGPLCNNGVNAQFVAFRRRK
jgi:hypothetical protein